MPVQVTRKHINDSETNYHERKEESNSKQTVSHFYEAPENPTAAGNNNSSSSNVTQKEAGTDGGESVAATKVESSITGK